MKKRMTRPGWMFLCFITLVMGAPALGQKARDEFIIAGTVVDQTGGSIPGATVLLRKNGHEQSTITSETGGFSFAHVTPGRHKIKVTITSFKPASVNVAVRDRNPQPLKIILALADLQQEVVASDTAGRVSTEAGENLDVVKLDGEELDDLPVLDQDIVSTLSRFLDASAFGTGGATLVVNGLETSGRGVPPSTIQEVRINRNPYSAEFSRPGRGRIEIITKAGASKFHGSFNFLFRDHHLDARNAFALERPPEQRRIYEGHLTGPVGRRGKTSFLIGIDREEEDLQSVIYASTVSGLFRANIANPQHETELSARLDHQFGKKNTVSLRCERAVETVRNDGVGGFSLPETAFDSSDLEQHIYYSHRTIISSKLINEFNMRTGSRDDRTSSLHAGVRRIVVEDTFTGGGAQADQRSTQKHVQVNDSVAWLRGKHSIKAGINVPDISRRGSSDRSNFDGTYSFSSLEDYVRGIPYLFQGNQGDPDLGFWHMSAGVFVQDDIRLRPNLSLGFGLRYELQNHIPDHNNLAPRISFAYSPGGKNKTVFRGGAGFFYDRTSESAIRDVLRYDGRRLRQFIVSNPGYPDPWSLGGIITERPPSLVRFAPGVRSPYSAQYSIGIERQLQKSTSLTVSYVENRGVKLFRSRDLNAPIQPSPLRPDTSLGRVRQIESSAGSRSRSLEFMLRGNLSRYFNGMIQYAAGRAYNNTNGINSLPADNYDLSGEWSRADYDARHRFNMLGTFKAGKLFNVGAALELDSGRPYSLILGRDENRDGSSGDRPPGVRRNTLQGPGEATLDLRWSRELRLSNKKKDDGPAVTIGLGVFNVLNRVNYSGYIGNLSSSFFGLPVASRPARRMQIALEFEF